MKIFAIVINIAGQNLHSASLSGHAFKIDPHEKYIRDNILYVNQFPLKRNGVHELITPSEVYQAYIDNQKTIVVATDIELSESEQVNLFNNILQMKDDETLKAMIQKPADAVKSKITKLNEELEETKEILVNCIEKLCVRGKNLGDLQKKTEDLANSSVEFKHVAVKLKNKNRTCGSLFNLFNTVKNWVAPDGPYTYKYRSVSKRS